MTEYKYFNRKIITDFNDDSINKMYRTGYLFGRVEKGQMDQVVSLKIDLTDFEFNTENRRIQRKVEWLDYEIIELPMSEETYDFNIHKTGKNFYEAKNNEKVFSASKIKELIIDSNKSNFNLLIKYKDNSEKTIGYAICYKNNEILHYGYPFYELENAQQNTGMGMIIRAIEYSIKSEIKEIYLGSVNIEKNLYKLQFNNSKWWNGASWENDILDLKTKIKTNSLI